jgi:hypothetical protein
MKDLFPGYYRPNEQEFSELWENCVFILDTNVLLNLYRYSEESRNDFIKVLNKIETRLWIPHQVALEFQENRTKVIEEQEKKFDSIKKILEDNQSRITRELHNFPSVNHETLIDKISQLFGEFLEEIKPLETKQLKSNEPDYIRDVVDSLFKGKIGEPPTELELESIEKEGEKRYKIKYPPGFKDEQSKKKKAPYLCNGMSFKREYGDLILWKEILKEVEIRNWKQIIFVTDDGKEDWWREEQGKTIGARPELVEEICKAGASMFYMYTPERFLKYAKEYIKVDIKEESIQQVEEISAIRNDLLTEGLTSKGYKAEQAVLRWLESEYPDDEIIQSFKQGIDLLRLTKDNSRIGYEIKYITGYSMPLILRNVQSYIRNFPNLELDEFQVVFVTSSRLDGKGFYRNLIGNVQKIITKSFMVIQANKRNQNLKNIGVIVGSLYLADANEEFPEPIFNPIKIIQNMNMDMEGM